MKNLKSTMRYTLINIFLLLPLYTIAQETIDFDLVRAKDFFINKEYGKAIVEFDKVIKHNDTLSYNFYLRGLCKYNLDNYFEAIIDFTKALKLISPNDFIDRNWKMGLSPYKVDGESEYQNGNGISLVDLYHHTYFYRGISKYELEDYRGAMVDFKELIKYEVDSNYLYWIAISYFSIEDYNEAIKYFSKAINLNEDNSDYFMGRGKSYLNLGNKEQACLDFSKAGELGSKEAYEFIKEYCNINQ